ncbi:MAG: 4-(cytidine 5'-diphospho)-2-C-methyl-D-erythritol kinase [Candidatus Desulfofervidaceae bacterium]|nr:4-(cytidine 5'-diphospho)-2-C-methyl-D-erythritol kinase [Candidatus Desulfofervidaceae bacterium]
MGINKMVTSSAFRIFSSAKVNLILKALGKRPDGYHEIFTLMQRVSLFDTLYINIPPEGDIKITTNHPQLPTDEENLIYKAAKLFFKSIDILPRARIHLVKRIPIAAGLGGGSSNAASTLLGLNTLLKHPFSLDDLLKMAVLLGSDVPFFLLKKPAVAKGKGEIVSPLSFSLPFWYIIISPPIHISTAGVYKQVRLTRKENQIKISCLQDVLEHLQNDLEKVVIEKVEEISEAKEILKRAGARYILMSGSGASVFALCQSKREALEIKRALILPEKWRSFLVKGL